uniref:CSRNP_N domain-containing protein n=1 Tax=Angiostrongylus cantonensis TaxID=6313 RepID=A0A0K0D3E6_ANGCA
MDHQKQNNKRVRFTTVKVYYFARTQGISTVPKSGEVSLGMVDKHFTERQFSLWPGHRPELKLTNESEDYTEPLTRKRKARIKMLKRSGVQVRKVNSSNTNSLESIRQSRILCGCHCENGVCLFDTCQCALEGIVCQVDGVDEFGMAHPCWCNAMSCSNPCGRTEFDPEHVRNHYQMTMMRLKHAEKTVFYCFYLICFEKGSVWGSNHRQPCDTHVFDPRTHGSSDLLSLRGRQIASKLV